MTRWNSCARSSGRARAGDLSSRLGGSSSTCSSSTSLLDTSKISSSWIEKSIGRSRVTIGGSGVTIEGMCGLSGKRSKTKEVDKEAWK